MNDVVRKCFILFAVAVSGLGDARLAHAQTVCTNSQWCVGEENNYTGGGAAAVYGNASNASNFGVYGVGNGGYGVKGSDSTNIGV